MSETEVVDKGMLGVGSLDEYMQKYGALLGQQAQKALSPLHVPSRDPVHPIIGSLKIKLFDAQAHVVTASAKCLKRQKSNFAVGEMGVGKTKCGMATAHVHADGKPYRALVFCPGQLTKKWEREIRETLPGVSVRHLESYRDVLKLWERRHVPAVGGEWWVIARDRAKMGATWRPAFVYQHAAGQRKFTISNDGHYVEWYPGSAMYCPTCHQSLMKKEVGSDSMVPMTLDDLQKRQRFCENEVEFGAKCGGPLWHYTPEVHRWAPAKLIHKKLKRYFDYLIVDEVHQEKGAETAQANAAGSLIAASKKVIPLTGTLIGGYAEHLRTLLFRCAPQSLVQEGFDWDNSMPFNERYGRIEMKVTEKDNVNERANKQSKGKKGGGNTTKYVRPGVMPTLFGRHLIQNAVFLSLDEVADNLPALEEFVAPVPMDAELESAYKEVEEAMLSAIKDMVAKGNKRLLGSMLNALMCYEDYPYDWPDLGYTEKDEYGEHFVHVVTPRSLDPKIIRPKEQWLLDRLYEEYKQGRQSWVYCQMTGKRDVAARLEEMVGRELGLRVKRLQANVPLKAREEWIERNGGNVDVVLSHPKLVETGLDLFSKQGLFNFASLWFYQTGYNTFVLRQASRRSWRIGQPLKCKIGYAYYSDTMQARAMTLMGKMAAASLAIEGKFSEQGLAAMAGDEGSMEMAMAKSLVNRLDDLDAGRAWTKVKQELSAGKLHPSVIHTEVIGPARMSLDWIDQVMMFA